jgi:hypothetical protein
VVTEAQKAYNLFKLHLGMFFCFFDFWGFWDFYPDFG